MICDGTLRQTDDGSDFAVAIKQADPSQNVMILSAEYESRRYGLGIDFVQRDQDQSLVPKVKRALALDAA